MKPEKIGQSLYVVDERRKLHTPRVLSDGVSVNYQDRIGRVGVITANLQSSSGTLLEYTRNLRKSVEDDLQVLADECRNGRFQGLVAFGDISRLAKSAKSYGFDVFNDFDPEDMNTVGFYSLTTGRIAEDVGRLYPFLRQLHGRRIQHAPLLEALISRKSLVERSLYKK